MDQIYSWISELTGISNLIVAKLLKSILIVLIIWITNKITLRLIFRQSDDVVYRYRWRKTLDYLTFFVGLIVISPIWINEVTSLVTFLGLLSAGIAIALKDPITDLAGWVFIVWRKPFEAGDRIQIGSNAGDVIDIRIFQFTIIEIGNWVDADQSTGRILHIPNSKIFSETLANYSIGFNYIWDEIGVLVTFESNWKKARQLLEDILNRNVEHITGEAEKKIKSASRKYMIFYTRLTPIVYTSVKDSGVMLTMRFLCDPRKRRSYDTKIWEDVLDTFALENDIDFAYPTQRFYNNASEGKSGTKPPSMVDNG